MGMGDWWVVGWMEVAWGSASGTWGAASSPAAHRKPSKARAACAQHAGPTSPAPHLEWLAPGCLRRASRPQVPLSTGHSGLQLAHCAGRQRRRGRPAVGRLAAGGQQQRLLRRALLAQPQVHAAAVHQQDGRRVAVATATSC